MSDRRPRYAPRERYRTRASAAETGTLCDFAATALDRPIVSSAEMEAIRATWRPCAAMSRIRPGPTVLVFAGVLAAAILAGLIVGAALGLI
jgi:hypothetical protein